MKIDTLKKLTYTELQQVYSAYLEKQVLSPKTVATSKNDAFYLLKHNNSVDFWELLMSEDFEEKAKRLLKETLERDSSGNINVNLNGYMSHLRKFRRFVFLDELIMQAESTTVTNKRKLEPIDIAKPSKAEVEFYLQRWEQLENYRLQEDAINKLFLEYAPFNTEITDVLLKAAVLNEFYSTNIFSIYPVAMHIVSLNIDQRLQSGDVSLIDELKQVEINGKMKQLYSFATKYCNHHNPEYYPIYDSYVDDVLTYFRDMDNFATFKSVELKNYKHFKEILISFRAFYGLQEYSLRQIDKYLWQLGKIYFPKKYK